MNVTQATSLFAPPAALAAAAHSNSSSASDPTQTTNNQFLTLLVTQLKNQSPLNPVDSNQFTTELVQINSLDELTQIKNILQKAATGASTSTTGG